MNEARFRIVERFAQLPPPWPHDLEPAIRTAVVRSGRKIVVLDDDPTGTQTVHGVPVLTEWPLEAIRAELEGPGPMFYVLTNSRSLPPADARRLALELGRNIAEASRQCGRETVVASRSDSTLRGHFPIEVEALAAALDVSFDAWLVLPCFFEGGRYTIDDVHYVAEGEWLVPAGQTESARDATFGYRASNLREWVEEKTAGRVPASEVQSLSLDLLRRSGPDEVHRRLWALPRGSVCIVNAADYRDLRVFVAGLLAAEAEGRRFLYRTAASFLPVRAGLSARGLVDPGEVPLLPGPGGLVVAGSYVPRTSRQLQTLLEDGSVRGIELPVESLLDENRCDAAIAEAALEADAGLERGVDVAVYTSRRLVAAGDAEASLAIGRRVSAAMVALVRQIATRPRYILAKGGVTSSDLATQGLGVRRATVLGQIHSGVPVWQLGPESRHPALTYIVFPGNVGDDGALAEVVRRLRNAS